MKEEVLDRLIKHVLEREKDNPEGCFRLAFEQIQYDEKMQKEFELKASIGWKYAGVICAYSGLCSSKLNFELRNQINKPISTHSEILKALLKEALSKIRPLNNVVLCRNEKHFQDKETILNWFKDNIGRQVKFPAFISTSENWQPVDGRLMFQLKTRESNSNARSIIPIMEIYQPGKSNLGTRGNY